MKRIFLLTILVVFLLACNVVSIATPTPTGEGLITNTPDQEPTVTMTATVTASVPTETPTSTGTVTSLPPTSTTAPNTPVPNPATATPTLVPVAECTGVPCGPNLLFNPGLEAGVEVLGVLYGFHQPYPSSPNILVPEYWGFEYMTGVNERNPSDQFCGVLRVPESGNSRRGNPDWDYRVDGYNSYNNPEAFRWFKTWACTNAGPVQSVELVEGKTYRLGFSVSTWSTSDANRTGNLSSLDSDGDRENIEYRLRYNFNNGPIFEGSTSRPFGYSDGVYDFTVIDNVAYYNGDLWTEFTVPVDSDAQVTQTVKVGITGSSKYAFGTMDYHVDNAYLYCMDCGYSVSDPDSPNPTPTPIVNTYLLPDNQYVRVVVSALSIREGASTTSPFIDVMSENDESRAYQRYDTETTSWVRISADGATPRWIALNHPGCETNICSILFTK